MFPLNNWTELDIWNYILRENIAIPSLYFAHEREVVRRNGQILAHSEYLNLRPDENPETLQVRFRTLGDLTITGAVGADADSSVKTKPGWPRPTRPSAVAEWTTSAASRPWRTARRKAVFLRTKDGTDMERGLLRFITMASRRRQEHADRPPAVRQQDHLRGPAGEHRAGLPQRGTDGADPRS